MKYCIYEGSIVPIISANGDKLLIKDDYGEHEVMTYSILNIPDEYESDIDCIKEQVKNINFRMNRLDDEYHKKSEALRELYMESREKEVSIINKVIKSIQNENESKIRSKVDDLPEDARKKLDDWLMKTGNDFMLYDEIALEITALGYPLKISEIGRYAINKKL